jgi:hypothetical protein
MKTRTGFVKDEDHANIVLLVEELGGLPLALEQAAAHIKSIKCSFVGISSGNKKDVISMTVFAAVPIPSLIDS